MSKLPKIPVALDSVISYLSKADGPSLVQRLEPFKKYESKLRELFAQEPGNKALNDPHVNTVPLFAGHESQLLVQSRNVNGETDAEKSKYILPLDDKARKVNGSPAIVGSLKDFRHNFGIFSEQSLSELDWSNVVAAGSSALTPLLPVPKEHSSSKRSVRNYYHNVVAPASDIDLFLYGLDEKGALEKIKQIEKAVKDSILSETTTIRTKNAITIASQHPVRHVQIVLRIYKSVSEILTGFDVDCSCVAYDGRQVHATPRALAALMTQINRIDLTRRSPSYESRLAKYAQRGFEVYWPDLDRTKVDPTIFERSFPRTVGLARLLVLERLPKEGDRERYNHKRRAERGRPVHYNFNNRRLRGNVKEDDVDDVADWQDEDPVSNYHSFTIPYGPKFHAKRIERLLYTKDLLLNAEWNAKERKVNLHRHPAFFGDAENVFEDCCEFCPTPETEEEKLISEEEMRYYVSGKMTFITDDPGRQAIGSFNPIDADDWTAMAYIGDTGLVCQAIVDQDLAAVERLLQDGIDVNRRDYTGRTLLHLATMTSTADIVRCLLKHGAYTVPRLADGQTALHLAAVRGDSDILDALFEKSEENKAVAAQSKDGPSAPAKQPAPMRPESTDTDEEAEEVLSEASSDSAADSEVSAANSDISAFLKVEDVEKYIRKDDKENPGPAAQDSAADTKSIEPKDDILDANLPAWDTACTPVHLATALGNTSALQNLCKQFRANPSIPIKLMHSYGSSNPKDAILSLVLALQLPVEDAHDIVKVLINAGAKSSQANMDSVTAFHFFANHSLEMLEQLVKLDKTHAKLALNHITFHNSSWRPEYLMPLTSAIENQDVAVIQRLLALGAEYEVDHDFWIAALKKKFGDTMVDSNNDRFARLFCETHLQPVLLAVQVDCPDGARLLVEAGADINTLNKAANLQTRGFQSFETAPAQTLLDAVRAKILELDHHDIFAPLPLLVEPAELDALLVGVKKDTYAHWSITSQIQERQRQYEKQVSNQRKLAAHREQDTPRLKQLSMIKAVSAKFKALEEFLVAKGAKTFVSLHYGDSIKTDEEHLAAEYQKKLKVQQAELKRQVQDRPRTQSVHKFQVSDPSAATTADYLSLFEAAWTGDLARIQELTMTFHGEEKDRPPLQITARDSLKHCPFDIAMLRGHTETAIAMLNIVQAQYMPKDQKRSYTIASDDEHGSEESEDEDGDSHCSSENSDAIRLYSRLPAAMRQQFTIENIGEISHTVKGDMSPIDSLRNAFPLRSIVDISGIHIDPIVGGSSGTDMYTSFFGLAMYKNDINLFHTLVDHALHHQREVARGDDSGQQSEYGIWHGGDLQTALSLGKVEFLEAMISRTGAGMSFDHLLKKEGLETSARSRYYKGLSIRGKKNSAWASAYHRQWHSSTLREQPLLLRACHQGNLKSVQWLLSDAPLTCYLEFTAANPENVGVKALSQSKGGVKNTIGDWLVTRQQLAISCAVMSTYVAGETEKLVAYLIEAMPDAIDAKSKDGRTALHIAAAYRRLTLVKLLLEAGANAEITDNKGHNVLHALLGIWRRPNYSTRGAPFDHKEMRAIIELFDVSLIKKLFLRRNAYSEGAQTPLQCWLSKQTEDVATTSKMHIDCTAGEEGCAVIATLRLILEYSGGEDLLIVDGAGDTAVHTIVAKGQSVYLPLVLDTNPACLLRENAVGRTPAEIARDRWLLEHTVKSPVVGAGRTYYEGTDRSKPLLLRERAWFLHAKAHVPTPAAQVWRICREHVAQNTHLKRRLVSLNEANEVAKRLAEKPAMAVFQYGDSDSQMAAQEEAVEDEVQTFFQDPHSQVYTAVYGGTCPCIYAA